MLHFMEKPVIWFAEQIKWLVSQQHSAEVGWRGEVNKRYIGSIQSNVIVTLTNMTNHGKPVLGELSFLSCWKHIKNIGFKKDPLVTHCNKSVMLKTINITKNSFVFIYINVLWSYPASSVCQPIFVFGKCVLIKVWDITLNIFHSLFYCFCF